MVVTLGGTLGGRVGRFGCRPSKLRIDQPTLRKYWRDPWRLGHVAVLLVFVVVVVAAMPNKKMIDSHGGFYGRGEGGGWEGGC